MHSNEAEIFVMDNPKSIATLRPNVRGEETSPHSYEQFILLQLHKHHGWMTQAQLEQAVLGNFGRSFGPDDLRLMRVGKSGAKQPKWRNNLAWAKVVLRKLGLILQRTRTVNGVKGTYVVLLAFDREHRQVINWVRGGPWNQMGRIKLKRPTNVRRHKLAVEKRNVPVVRF